MSYHHGVGMLKNSPRPVTMTFTPAVSSAASTSPREAAAASPRTKGTVQCTFTQTGTLGLKFSDQHGKMVVVAINPGTQACVHPVAAGMQLISVAGTSVVGVSYPVALGLIKQSGRPLTLAFDPGDGEFDCTLMCLGLYYAVAKYSTWGATA